MSMKTETVINSLVDLEKSKESYVVIDSETLNKAMSAASLKVKEKEEVKNSLSDDTMYKAFNAAVKAAVMARISKAYTSEIER